MIKLIITIIIVLVVLWLIYHYILSDKKGTSEGFSIYRLADYVHAPLKCNALPYRPGCCDLAQCRQPGAQVDQFGNLQVYTNLKDILNIPASYNYYNSGDDEGGYGYNVDVKVFDQPDNKLY